MIYRNFQDIQLSLLGFGAMRLPLLEDGNIDEAQVFEMVRHAAEHGVNYYDTAFPYHKGKSEIVLGKALKQLPRESFYLATKYPGHQISDTYYPAEIFEEQLEKCGVDYFDFYLLHNVYENSVDVYTDPQWGIIDYFIEQKKLGRIKHLGFSSHALIDTMKDFLEQYGKEMEFCQIQLNYLDWTLQGAKEKCELLAQYGIPIWVMEPIRGGKLAKLDETSMQQLRTFRPDETAVGWAFRFLQGIPNIKMILSGMSEMEQMVENVAIFEDPKPLSKEEQEVLLQIAETMKASVPCTACRYCCEGCPQQLDIPKLLKLYSDMKFSPNSNIGMTIDSLAEEYRPSACVECGQCVKVCPQKIDIPGAMKDFCDLLDQVPHWAELCKQRAEEARKAREERLAERG